MTIKIGEKSYVTARPKDLDERVAALTGCSAGEIAQQMTGSPIAGHVAAALHPFLRDPPSVPELAAEIAAAGVEEVRAEVAKLYAPVAEPEPQAAKAGG